MNRPTEGAIVPGAIAPPKPPHPTSFAVARFRYERDNKVLQQHLSLAELIELLTHHVERQHKKGTPLWSPTHYLPDALTRGNQNVETVSCLVFDFDNGMDLSDFESRWSGFGYIAHSSFSHTPNHPKWRVIFPLLSPIPAAKWTETWLKLNFHLAESGGDQSCKDASRAYYIPSHPAGAVPFSTVHDGAVLDPGLFPDLPEKRPISGPQRAATYTGSAVRVSVLIGRALRKVRAGEGRHNTGLWLACQLRDNRFPKIDALECLYPSQVPKTDSHGVFDPYTEDEWVATVEDAYSKPARDPWPDPMAAAAAVMEGGVEGGGLPDEAAGMPFYALTELGNAERLAYRYGHVLRYCPQWGKWLIWDTARWKEDDDFSVSRLAYVTTRGIFDEAKNLKSPEQQETTAKWAIKSESSRGIDAMLKMAKTLPPIPIATDDLDSDRWISTCVNGTLDLRTGALIENSPFNHCTKMIPHAYNPYADCPRWLRFLDEIMLGDQELVDFLQRAAGYCLTGDTSEQSLFFLFGTGANGKSTFIETLFYVLGSNFSRKTQAQTLMRSKGDRRHSADLADLRGARLVVASEVAENEWLDEALVKDMTGGDSISARFMRQDYFQFVPEFKLWLYGNHKPNIRDTSTGMWRRVKLIPFLATFGPEEQDHRLAGILRSEAEGILSWLVDGCLSRLYDGLNPPASVMAATDDYRVEMDALIEWVNDECVLGPQCQVSRRDLYHSYRAWCEANGQSPKSQRRFTPEMKEKYGLQDGVKSYGERHLQGIGLATQIELTERAVAKEYSNGVK